MKNGLKRIFIGASILCLAGMSACAAAGSVADNLNPYADGNKIPAEYGGERNTGAIMGGGGGAKSAEAARHALEVMGTYRKALPPEPTYPVIQPAEVRLMWIPDHLNAVGDLIPAHYYYLRVLPDRPAVTDAFEIERQLDLSTGGYSAGASGSLGTGSGGSTTPWVYKETR
ncbi:MAG TPA: hypothetical protein PKA63_13180 [Oligoflexia bacterium]|nr:hypothetical protein [Oligoflexia bacterium]HMP49613.1 hypothetical protein [Oligoflexia bacterium]